MSRHVCVAKVIHRELCEKLKFDHTTKGFFSAITQECCEQYWTSPGGNTEQSTNYTATYLPSRKLSKYIYIYIYKCVSICVCIYVYIYVPSDLDDHKTRLQEPNGNNPKGRRTFFRINGHRALTFRGGQILHKKPDMWGRMYTPLCTSGRWLQSLSCWSRLWPSLQAHHLLRRGEKYTNNWQSLTHPQKTLSSSHVKHVLQQRKISLLIGCHPG